jgi:ubiquitin C-terminal hydrolase
MPLVRVFLSEDYRDDINEHNPLGKGGEVAYAFGGLVARLWQGGIACLAPRAFRKTLGKHSELSDLCQGYEQHDSQELMAKLLDMLHEDINRVKQKPYVEEEEDSGRPDSEMAERAWRAHLYASAASGSAVSASAASASAATAATEGPKGALLPSPVPPE